MSSTPEQRHEKMADSGSNMARTRLTILLFCLLISGCAIKQPPKLDEVSHAPLIVDDAMQHRQWPVSAARYANGQTVANPTGSLFVHRPNEPVWQGVLTDAPMFVANVLTIPIVYIFTPPWETVAYPRGEIEASYHAMPPLPPK